MRALPLGAVITALLSCAALVYLGLTPQELNRPLLAGLSLLAAADGFLMWRGLPVQRLAATGRLGGVLLVWNLLHVAAISASASLDGGLSSPFVAMFFVSIVFAALTIEGRPLVLVGIWVSAGLLVVGLAGGGDATLLPILTTCVLASGLIGATVSRELQRRINALHSAQEETIEKLARAVEYRDASTGGHIDRMARIAGIVAGRLGLPAQQSELLLRAGPLHDVGKIGVPDAILLKPGPLTPVERRIMQRHAQAGHDLLCDSESELLQLGAVIALCHHERWDGAGYPNGLRGEEIPLAARIVSVADVFDALTTDRIYRLALPFDVAAEIIREGRGTQFDPEVVDAFLSALDEVIEVAGRREATDGPPPRAFVARGRRPRGSRDAASRAVLG